jgi:hypothetical protein
VLWQPRQTKNRPYWPDLHAFRCVLPRLVPHRDQADGRVAHEEHGHGLALILQAPDLGFGLRRERREGGRRLGRTQEQATPLEPALHALTAERHDVNGRRDLKTLGLRPCHDGLGNGVGRGGIQCGGILQNLPLAALQENDVRDLGPTRCESAGLVEGNGGHLAEGLQHGPALDQQVAAGTGRQTRRDGGRSRCDEGTGAADQEHGQPLV